jgi:hypothetical protein
MACVDRAEQVVKGDSRLGRGDAAAVSRKLYITVATFSRRGAFNMRWADDNRKDRRMSIEVNNAIIG